MVIPRVPRRTAVAVRVALSDATPLSRSAEAGRRRPEGARGCIDMRLRRGARSATTGPQSVDGRSGRFRRSAYSPVTPSIRSRMRSAWPLWRAYSSIMCR